MASLLSPQLKRLLSYARPYAFRLALGVMLLAFVALAEGVVALMLKLAVDYVLEPAKVGKQFQLAEDLGAARAVVIGQEWPLLRVKLLSDRTEKIISVDDLRTLFASI